MVEKVSKQRKTNSNRNELWASKPMLSVSLKYISYHFEIHAYPLVAELANMLDQMTFDKVSSNC